MKKNIDVAIAAVTVYTDRALVTRKDIISLTGEENELILSQLPATLLQDSVRVTGKGRSTVNILGVKVQSIFTPEAAIESIAQLDRQIQILETQQVSLENQLRSQQLQLDFIEKLSEKSTNQYAINLSKQQTNLEQAEALLGFIGDKYLDASDRIAEFKLQQQEIKNQISALEKQKKKLLVPKNKEHLNLIIFIEASEAGDFELEVSYLVKRASWTPLYDLQVDTTEKQLNLTYLAEVKQNTGEDWHNVALTLSTAKPGLGTLPPKLQPWYIDVYSSVIRNESFSLAEGKQAKSSTRRKVQRSDNQPGSGIPIMAAAPAAESDFIDAEVVTATVTKSGSVVTFEIDGGGDIPSDNTPHKVTVFRERYPTHLEYVAVPRLVSFTYLQAIVTNPATGVTLLPGKANILREQTFVGTTSLENISPAQKFTLNLGIDEGWKIERNLVQRQVDKKLIGGYKRITYAYRIIVNNLLETESSLKITEQLPVSRNENLKVRLIQVEPKIKLGEMGILEWILTLSGSEQQEINYQFTLEYPPEVSLSGIDI